jgi:hypothetical protein
MPEDVQQSLSASLSAQSGEKANMDKEKSTGLNRLGVSGPLLRMANMSPFLFCTCLNMLMMPCLCKCSVILKDIKF